MMYKVDDKSLDVTSIMILIGHYHEVTVSKGFDVRLVVLGTKFETHNLDKVHNLLVFHDLSMCCITNIEWLTLQGEYCV